MTKAEGTKGALRSRKQQSNAMETQRNGASAGGKRPLPPPVERPPFTVGDIRRAIPKHCFQRSALTSFRHLIQDLSVIAVLGYAATWISSAPLAGQVLLWPLYWFLQGAFMTGVWVIAHECGHQAFSDYKWLNNLVGWVCHSALLVPYHSWQISHHNHHMHTNSMDDDEVFVPPTRSDVGDMLNESPIMQALMIVNMLLLGWPAYLIANAAGPKKYAGKRNSHFDPDAALFRPKDYLRVVWSDAGFILAIGALVYASKVFGFSSVFFYYLVPYLNVNMWLVMITYLQHTDSYIPHLRGNDFDWLRGALCTVDRSFGWFLNMCHHHIADTHVCHHLFSSMPFYNAMEATPYIRKVLGPYYLQDNRNVWLALWESFSECRFVEDNGGYLHFKKSLKE